MKLSSPKQITWVIALIVGIAGVLAYLLPLGIPALGFWLIVIAWLLLVLATAMDGL